MIAEENLVLVVKGGVIGAHLAPGVISLFLLEIAGGVEIVVVAAVGDGVSGVLIAGFTLGIRRTDAAPAGFCGFRHPRGAVAVLQLAGIIDINIVFLVRREVQGDTAVTHLLFVVAVLDFIFCPARQQPGDLCPQQPVNQRA